MSESCLAKQTLVEEAFKCCPSKEALYEKIIEMGRNLPKLDNCYKVNENIVSGCQSQVFLRSYLDQNCVIFEAEADSLISAGLAALLIKVYSGEPPETILTCPPTYLQKLGIDSSLTPNRANGLYSLHLKMKQEAAKLCCHNPNCN